MADPDPISEQLAAKIVARLQGVKKSAGYTGDLDVMRATTSKVEIDPTDLKTIVWCDDPEPQPAPWGQSGWLHRFEVATYVRESEESGIAIDRRMNLAIADVQRALMSDPRFGGLCFVDAKIVHVLTDDGQASGLASVRNYLQCEYRTLRSDPRMLAPVALNQSFFQGGGVLLLAAYAEGTRTLGPWRRYDNLHIVPLLEPQTDRTDDDREGLNRTQDEQFIGYRQRYEIDGDWLNPQLLAWQLGGASVSAFTQTATPRLAVAHVVSALDAVLPLHDVDGDPVFNVASIEAVTNAGAITTYAAPADYLADAASLREGLLKIPAGSSIVPGSAVLVSFTPAALTARPAFDVAMACSYRVRARVMWQAADGQMLVHGDFDGSLVVQSATRDPETTSTTRLQLSVLDDGSDRPAGRMIIPTGTMPTAAGY